MDQSIYTWNPWHGCHKCKTGCLHCYVCEQDKCIGVNYNNIKLNKVQFRLPVQKFRSKEKKLEKYELEYKIPNGSIISVCDTSDFFLEEADAWRVDAWDYIHQRKECLFSITTKRTNRIKQCLPDNWLDGWYNVRICASISCENDAWELIPSLLDLPIKHLGIEISPMVEDVDLSPFLSSGLIEQVIVRGERYNGYDGISRLLDINWVYNVQEQCKDYNVNFIFDATGTRLKLKNNQIIKIKPRDEHGLAEFYSMDYSDDSIVNWKAEASEIERQLLNEDAYRIFKLINQES